VWLVVMIQRMRFLFSVSLLLAVPPSFAATRDHVVVVDRSADQTFYPRARGDLILNPGIGYQTFYQSAATDKQFPSSTMYVRFYWSSIEKAPGVFDFNLIDRALAQARAAGQRLAFRIMAYDNTNGGPIGLRQAGFHGFVFTFDGADVWVPNFDDDEVRQDLQKLIAALGSRYGNDTAIDSVDVGLIGDWGEQHFWNTYPKPPYPSLRTLKWLSDEFKGHFAVPVLVNDGIWENDPEAFRYAVRSGLGWRVDCWGGQREMTSKYPNLLLDVADAWRSAPVILEPCGVMGEWQTSSYPWRESFQWAIDNHVSEISNKGAQIPDGMREEAMTMLRKLGYRFVLKRATLPAVAKVGRALRLELDWANEGNAPMYFERHLLLKLGPKITETDISMRGFLPGTRTDVVTIETADMAAGTYPVEIGLAPPATRGPDITLAIAGEGPWYRLGTVTLRN
jgi:hypothetical protein